MQLTKFPIYTGETECRDCYKCIRSCEVKSIRMENNEASIIEDRCILCGECVQICPQEAKHVRVDVRRVQQLLTAKRNVYFSLAPSWVNEFVGVRSAQIISALKKLGAAGVSETALGAQEVSAHLANLISQDPNKIWISSACPSVVQLVSKYYPQHCENITPLQSPVLAHAGLLKKEYGDDISVVFVGPCISKKLEADQNPDLLEMTLTFKEVSEWMAEVDIIPIREEENSSEFFALQDSAEGALYPVEGGMIKGIKSRLKKSSYAFSACSGVREIMEMMEDFPELKRSGKGMFIEAMSCNGGCINGPGLSRKSSTVLKRSNVLNRVPLGQEVGLTYPILDIGKTYPSTAVEKITVENEEIREILKNVGKYSSLDDLNCSGCGYDSCMDFGKALLEKKAEENMCVSWLRKLSQKKSNAMLSSMPSGVVIVDRDLHIVEFNARFSSLVDKKFGPLSDLEGVYLPTLVPFTDYFETVLRTGEDLPDISLKHQGSVYHASIFSIEEKQIVGGVFLDVTESTMQKEQIIEKTRNVIKKNLSTVQQIAYLIGENASETEVILDSVIGSFSTENGELE